MALPGDAVATGAAAGRTGGIGLAPVADTLPVDFVLAPEWLDGFFELEVVFEAAGFRATSGLAAVAGLLGAAFAAGFVAAAGLEAGLVAAVEAPVAVAAFGGLEGPLCAPAGTAIRVAPSMANMAIIGTAPWRLRRCCCNSDLCPFFESEIWIPSYS